MRYLTPEEILAVHARVIEQTGGSDGLRDVGLLFSIAERPKATFGAKELYPTVFEKAAAYIEGLIRYHPFLDGNKRGGVVIMATFLYLNGYTFSCPGKELDAFAVEIATNKHPFKDIVAWIQKHTQGARGE